jgi:hypothetical protein
MSYCINIPKQRPTLYTCKGFPPVKTCGSSNPYYIYQDFYHSESLGRNINKCKLENYWILYLKRNINLNPNKKVVEYYRNIVAYIRPLYQRFVHKDRLRYSNLSPECSALFLIKNILSKLPRDDGHPVFPQEEVAKIIALFGIETTCNCE